jgi:hypothetical protein
MRRHGCRERFGTSRSRRRMWLRNLTMRALPHLPWKGLVAGAVDEAADAIRAPGPSNVTGRLTTLGPAGSDDIGSGCRGVVSTSATRGRP